MRLIDKFIQWIVAFNIIIISVSTIFEVIANLFFPVLSFISFVVRPIFLLLMLFFQIRYFGIKVYNKFFFFFLLVYNIYILLYLTILRIYPIDQLLHVPLSLVNFFYRLFTLLGYLLCAKTIVIFFDVRKFLVLSIFFTIVPSLFYMQFVNLETMQLLENFGEDKLSLLSLGYSNIPILVLALFSLKKSCNHKLINTIFSIVVIILTSYIILMSSKRGPIVWAIVNIVLCLYFTMKNFKTFLMGSLLIGSVVLLNIDLVIDGVGSFAPKTAERISATIYEKDTSGRFDSSNKTESTYLLGLKTFETSPLWGSYFRIVTDLSYTFRGAYPHNIFIEMLMTMGLIGFIPFLLLLLKAFRNARCVFKGAYSSAQLSCLILFLAPFLKLQTTDTVVVTASFWVFFYIMCILNNPKLIMENIIQK